MIEVICRRAFFEFELPIRYAARLPRGDANVRTWGAAHMLPALVELEGTPAFADVYAAWNEDGLAVGFDVPNRNGPLHCDPVHWWKQDGVRICVDTRDTRDIKRASRFCHLFYALPVGGGPKANQPVVGLHRMSRAKETAPPPDLSLIRAAAHIDRHGYTLGVTLPAACLHGWDPAEHARIGLFYKIKDTRLGEQHLTVDDELGWNVDPSTWATGVLVR